MTTTEAAGNPRMLVVDELRAIVEGGYSLDAYSTGIQAVADAQ